MINFIQYISNIYLNYFILQILIRRIFNTFILFLICISSFFYEKKIIYPNKKIIYVNSTSLNNRIILNIRYNKDIRKNYYYYKELI